MQFNLGMLLTFLSIEENVQESTTHLVVGTLYSISSPRDTVL